MRARGPAVVGAAEARRGPAQGREPALTLTALVGPLGVRGLEREGVHRVVPSAGETLAALARFGQVRAHDRGGVLAREPERRRVRRRHGGYRRLRLPPSDG